RSFWYPTWLAQAAAMVPESRLVDAPPHDLSIDTVVATAAEYDMVVMHTSTPSVYRDADTARRIREVRPDAVIGLVGAHPMVLPEQTLAVAPAADFVTTGEFEEAVAEIAAGRPLEQVRGIAWRAPDGSVVRNPPRPPIRDLDVLPFVVDVYARDLDVTKYAIGYLEHPYLSLYTGRGCRSKCTFCLWPQTIAGHVYRTRSPANVLAEMKRARELFPQVREFFFDDDTFTDDRPRAEEIARGLGRLGLTWSCNAKANVPLETLRILKDNGLRLLLVGYESGSQRILNNIRKGTRVDRALRFAEDCHKLGILVHGTFVVGLPGETRETIEETIRFAKRADPYSIQVSLAAPYPGTELYRQAEANGWLVTDDFSGVVEQRGVQVAALSYPELSAEEIHAALERMYRAFYMRPRPILRILRDMLRDPVVLRRRLREGREFLSFMTDRRESVNL
ncbi:MAG: hopanoid biosynthesis associated radical SAM protein HpnJ, partial [Deltaproteobacteria bacterium]